MNENLYFIIASISHTKTVHNQSKYEKHLNIYIPGIIIVLIALTLMWSLVRDDLSTPTLKAAESALTKHMFPFTKKSTAKKLNINSIQQRKSKLILYDESLKKIPTTCIGVSHTDNFKESLKIKKHNCFGYSWLFPLV